MDIPKKAEIHIQNRAPGPPVEIAPVTPKIFPGPTRMAVDRRNDARDEIPVPLLFCLIRTWSPWRNFRTWINRSLNVK